jgi:aminopeptidase N
VSLNVLYCKLVLFLQAGDRSLASVVAHEISHSWTGNLVTNRNFEHFWLNEGFTRFVEGKIVGKLHGEKARHLSAIGGLKDLRAAVSAVVPHLTLWLIDSSYFLCNLGMFSSYRSWGWLSLLKSVL